MDRSAFETSLYTFTVILSLKPEEAGLLQKIADLNGITIGGDGVLAAVLEAWLSGTGPETAAFMSGAEEPGA